MVIEDTITTSQRKITSKNTAVIDTDNMPGSAFARNFCSEAPLSIKK